MGISHLARFDVTNDPADIEEAIRVTRQALHATPDGHWEKWSRWCDLGLLLHIRFEHFGRTDDLEEAHVCHLRAVDGVPDDHQQKPRLLRYLGCSHRNRFKTYHRLADIDKAVEALYDAVGVAAEDRPERVFYWTDLGYSLVRRYLLSQDPADIERAASVFKEAALLEKGSLWSRMEVSVHWGTFVFFRIGFNLHLKLLAFKGEPGDDDSDRALKALELENFGEVYEAFSRMMELIPQLVWLGDTISVRHWNLERISEFVRRAASIVAGFCKQPTRAAEWIEQGRSMVWRQQLNLRTPLDELDVANPVLAKRLKSVSVSLDSTSFRNHNEDGFPSGSKTADDAAPTHRQLAEEWERLLQEARQDEGFERFLKPKQLSELRQAAQLAPIVVLNLGLHCHALMVMEDLDDVLHISLGVTMAQVEQLNVDLGKLLTRSRTRS